MPENSMATNGQTTSYDYSRGSSHEKDRHDDHPLALHNLPTHVGSASHHEHVHDQALPSGEKQQHETLDLNRTSSTVHKARRVLGLHPQAPILEEHDTAEHAHLRWTKARAVLKEPLAEFFGMTPQ